MSNKNQQIPAIRFKGFTDDWEQRELGELASKIGSGKTPRGGSSVYTQSGIPLLRSQNIYDDKVSFEDVAFINDSTDEDMANSRVNRGDVLLNITGASIGRSAVYELSATANVNQHVCIIRPSSNVHSYFIQLNLASSEGQKQIELNQAGGGREGLNFQQIAKMSFYYPSLEEQIKLGVFFQQLNKTIALHQRQLNNYKELKQTMLKKIFNQELRFKDQNGNDYPNWEEKKLGEIAKYTNGKSNEGNVLENGKYNLINLNSISIDGKLKNVHKSTDIVTVLLKKDDLVMILSDVGHGDLLGRVAVIPENEKYVLNQRVAGLSVVKLANPTYLYYFINFHQKYFKLMGKGMAQLNISKGDVEDFVVQLPYEDEQHKIADFLSTIDKQLETVEQTVKLLEEQKKGLMQKMFV